MNMENRFGQRPLRVGSWPGPSYSDNPFVRIFCDALGQAGAEIVDVEAVSLAPDNLDILQIHWPEQVYWTNETEIKKEARAIKTLRAIRRLRKQGTKVVWLVHNLKPHDASRRRRAVWRFYSSMLARLVDGYLSLSPATLPAIAGAYPFSSHAKGLALRHPAFPTPPLTNRAEAREEWNVPTRPLVLSFVGHVRRYKGVESLITAASALGDLCSVIVGGKAIDGDLEADIRRRSDDAGNAVLRLGRLSEAEFQGLVLASDYVVLPFVDVLHSGSVVYALSLGRPVLTPRRAYMEDLRNVIGAEWLHLYNGDLNADVLRSLPPPPRGLPDLSALSPTIMGHKVVTFYRSLTSQPQRTRTC